MLSISARVSREKTAFFYRVLPIVFQLKGYKVTDVNRMRKIGVACRSLHELKQKACAKLNVSIPM